MTPRGCRTTLGILCSAILALAPSGCAPQDPAVQLDAYAQAAATSRVNAASGLIAAFKADQITVDDALTHAFDKLDKGEDATAYAGAVLDMIQAVEGQLSQGGEFEIFWTRVGRLAAKAAEVAFEKKRYEEAATLMLAGGRRWQNESYWIRYPSHDALVAYVLTVNGRKGEALQRLASRSELLGPAEEAYEQIKAAR
ncbi:MAG: hypothetical protein L6Q35_05200 [Phycisphaerales bacterium]|nr:hypothetical protein [Phycisphaerales bacterium]